MDDVTKNFWWATALLTLVGGCGEIINVGDCKERCEMQNAEACSPFAMDCEALCDRAADVSSTSGCGDELNRSQRCLLDEGVCDPDSCTTETRAYIDCVAAFCGANPEADVCPTGP